jgi:glyoxylase-like metal-dependent hydrolase (beta-lactamase superfamily II)
MPELADHDIARLRADNPSPYTLDGTNTWVIGRDPAWVVDPGPALDEHLDAIAAEVAARGGAGGIALTHDHADHAEAVPALRERLGGAPVAAARFPGDVVLADGDAFGPLRAVAIPGHADDHLAFVAGAAAFTGDAVLGEGSVFVTGRLGEYLGALERLRGLGLEVLCPGHGPPVWDPDAKLGEYLAHRAERERKLLAALDAGARTEDELLDAAWADAPPALRPAAALTLRAHTGKLAAEGRLPDDVRLA